MKSQRYNVSHGPSSCQTRRVSARDAPGRDSAEGDGSLQKMAAGKGNRGSEEICGWPAACRGSIRPAAEFVDRLLIEILRKSVVCIFYDSLFSFSVFVVDEMGSLREKL